MRSASGKLHTDTHMPNESISFLFYAIERTEPTPHHRALNMLFLVLTVTETQIIICFG
jgi:hypothetical protein